jgi:hypothetical protein
MLDEHVVKTFSKEEEFLDEFGETAIVAAKLLNGEWHPNYFANDSVRANLKYFFSRGEVNDLAFDFAAVYHDKVGFSSVQIILKSSHRVVSIRVRKMNNELVGEKIVDKSIEKTSKEKRES